MFGDATTKIGPQTVSIASLGVPVKSIKISLIRGLMQVDGYWEKVYSANGEIERTYTIGLTNS